MIKCADVEPMVNGDVSYEHESRVVNTVVTYVCGPGYYLDGNRMRTCTADRTWVPSPGPSCGESFYFVGAVWHAALVS